MSSSSSSSEIISPTVSLSEPVLTLYHPMQIRSKSWIPRPTVLLSSYIDELFPKEPSIVQEALNCPYWFEAMNREYSALSNNKTWALIEAHSKRKIIGCK